MQVHITIKGDPSTGAVQAEGHIDDLRVVHWLLGECRRICEGRAQKREAERGNGKAGLVIVPDVVLPPV